MKVFMVLGDAGGSGFYRIKEPARIAQLHGVDITVDSDIPVTGTQWVLMQNGERVGVHKDEVHELNIEADVIVLPRPLRQSYYEVALAAKRQGMAVVADLDDDFHNVHHQNVAVSSTRRKNSPLENTRWLMKTLALCDVITVSTPALLKYEVPGTKAVVVRNRLPEAILTLPKRLPTGQIGWTGNVATHPEDLQSARGVLDQIDTRIAIIGHVDGVAEALDVPPERVQYASSWVAKVPIYWRALNGSMDVGIVPLERSKFNNAKSALKGTEYVSLGKPFIASPLPEYKRLVEESGAGIIAVGPRQWATAAQMLLENGDGYRKAGAEWARENTLERHIDEWISTWELALELRGK